MKYRCLRDCYVEDRLFAKGEIYELPDAFPKYEKNFGLMDEPAPEPVTEPVVTVATEKSREPKPGEYLCSKCNGIHRETSKLGKRHLKYTKG